MMKLGIIFNYPHKNVHHPGIQPYKHNFHENTQRVRHSLNMLPPSSLEKKRILKYLKSALNDGKTNINRYYT